MSGLADHRICPLNLRSQFLDPLDHSHVARHPLTDVGDGRQRQCTEPSTNEFGFVTVSWKPAKPPASSAATGTNDAIRSALASVKWFFES